MPRLSKLIEKLELRLEKKAGHWYKRHKEKLRLYIPLALAAWYFYGMLLNSLKLGRAQTFNATGEVMFYGKGAGELPTASACVADVIECLQEERHRPEIGWSADTGGFASPLTLKNRWYFRVGTDTLPEALHSAKVLEQGTETAFITPPITGTDAERLAAYLPTLAKMRVLD